MLEPQISVIVPTYNVDKYLKACLNSIVEQTFKKIEIICIDDCSSDKTVEILESYKKNDNRIIIIQKPFNTGLSETRNLGLSVARGKYIAFIDSDDFCDLDLFRLAFQSAEEHDSDLVLWDYVAFRDETEIKRGSKTVSDLSGIDNRDRRSLLKLPAFTWLKLVRLSVAKKIDVQFPNGLKWEDIPIHWKLILEVDKISIIPQKLVYYRQHTTSITNKKDIGMFDIFEIMAIVKRYLLKKELFECYRNEFVSQQLNLFYAIHDGVSPALKNQALKCIKGELNSVHFEYIHKRKPLQKGIRIFYLSINGSFFMRFQYRLWLIARSSYRKVKALNIR